MSGYGDPQVLASLKTGVQDVGLIGSIEPRLWMGYKAIMDFQKDLQTVQATNFTPNGLRWTFRLEKNADHYERLLLSFGVQLTTTGGTYKRCSDGAGVNCIDHVELRNGSQLVQTIYPAYETFARLKTNYTKENQEKLFPLIGLGLTQAVRNTRAAGTNVQTFSTPLELYWRDNIMKDPIVPGIANFLTIDVYLKDPSLWVETDGTTVAGQVVTFSNVNLYEELIFGNSRTRAYKTNLVTNGGHQEILYDERASIPGFVVPAGTTAYQPVSLLGLNGPLKNIYIWVQPAANVNNTTGPYQNQAYTFDWNNNPSTVEIRSNQQSIVRPWPLKNILTPLMSCKYHTAGPVNFAEINFSETPELTDAATGHLNLQFSSNPQMYLVWATPTTQNLWVEIWGMYYNFIQHTDGALRRLFAP